MSDVFISYAREDKDFVALLHEALARAGRKDWVDWKDIPPTADWMKEIQTAIEAAHSCVFVISPDSIVSDICCQELEHAVKHNKRLIPIVRHMVEETVVPGSLRTINWIFFREDDEFQTSFSALLNAIDTDLNWVHAHTRLLTRALEWDNKRRDKSFLLRGQDLQEAEQWLAQSGEKGRKPTSLQIQHIQESRKATTVFQRRTIGTVTLGMVVASVLAILAWYQYSLSEQRRNVALSRQMAAQARGEIPSEGKRRRENDIPRSLLLAAEAVQTSSTLEARTVLLDSLFFQPHKLHFFWESQDFLNATVNSDDGKILAVLSDGTLIQWDQATGQSTRRSASTQGVFISKAVFSPTGKILVYLSKGSISVRNIALNNMKDLPLKIDEKESCGFAFSPDEKFLAVVKPDTSIVIWDIVHGEVWKELASIYGESPRQNLAVALTNNAETLAISSTADLESTIDVWDVRQGQHLWTRKIEFLVESLTLSGDDLAAGGGYLPGSSGAPQPQELLLLDLKKNEILGHSKRESTNPVSSLAFSPDGKALAATYSDGIVILWDIDHDLRNSLVLGETLYGLPDDIDFIAFGGQTAESQSIVLGSKSYVETIDMSAMNSLELENQPADKTRRDFVRTFEALPENQRLQVRAVSPNGRIFAFDDLEGEGHKVKLQDSLTGAAMGNSVSLGDFSELAVAPNGRQFAVAMEDEVVKLFDIETNKFETDSSDIPKGNALAFSPDGKTLAIARDDEITLWDTTTRKTVSQLSSAHPLGSFMSLTFSSDGKTIASSHFKSSDIRLWDIAAQKLLDAPLNCRKEAIASVLLSFSPDGKTLSLMSDSGSSACDVDSNSWVKHACQIAGRNLACSEWRKYLGNEPYHATCDFPKPLDCK